MSILSDRSENLKDFLQELKINRNLNNFKKLENRIDIDYVIERIEGILKGE